MDKIFISSQFSSEAVYILWFYNRLTSLVKLEISASLDEVTVILTGLKMQVLDDYCY